MKLLFKISVLVFLFSLNSCNKVNRTCTTEVETSSSDHLISDEQLVKAELLLNAANLDYSNYQIYRFEKSFLNSQHIRCHQFMNGLQIFTEDIIFHFDENNDYQFSSGDAINSIALDNKSKMSQNELKKIYINRIKKDSHAKNYLNKITRNCLEMQFGYYDLNAGKGDSTIIMKKVWKITPLNSDSPKMFVNDDNSEVISFHNGVVY